MTCELNLKMEDYHELLIILDDTLEPDKYIQEEAHVYRVGSAVWQTLMDSLPVEPRLEIELKEKNENEPDVS